MSEKNHILYKLSFDSKMKVILLFVVCAIACAAAFPDCSQEKFNSCDDPVQNLEPPLTSADLDVYCRAYLRTFDCKIDLSEKCPNAPFAKYLNLVKFGRKNTVRVCENPKIRRKYLENAVCFGDAAKKLGDHCPAIPTDFPYTADEQCRKLREQIKCVEDFITDKCGQDATDVFITAQDPEGQLKIFGCA